MVNSDGAKCLDQFIRSKIFHYVEARIPILAFLISTSQKMQENNIALLSTAYLAPVQYYTKLISFDKVLIEKHENFTKQSFRNRCMIYGANGPLTLSIPLIKGITPKTLITDIEIDYTENWQNIHWRSIVSAYRSSPFFEYYFEELEPFYTKKIKYLFDFNLELQNTICEILEIEPEILFTDDFIIEPESQIDFRNSIHPKKRCAKPDPNFSPQKYFQVFEEKHGFIPNLSIIDLIFNEGSQALTNLEESIS